MPNQPVANPGVAERAPWQSTKRGVAGVSSLLDSRNAYRFLSFPMHLRHLVRHHYSLAKKALSATRGLAGGGGLGTRQLPCLLSRTFVESFWGFARGFGTVAQQTIG